MPTFRFDVDRSYALAALPFGVRADAARVTVGDGRMVARFGPWTVDTALTNIASTEFSGPFHVVKTAGPAHLTFSDRGLTFATTGRQGLMIRFHEPVRGIDPLGLIRHPNLTVTVLDREALAAALAAG
ncbi:hypothetical protein ACXR2U_18040 [Jatrophihabitans sp. YIM 134969]